ncbi:hypothetical protein CLV60_101288 [Dyadobacter jiangsuensis]|uniref:Uncharacterized protein n=1 Tax=Dyadobacter jiangsuensis TaxID=1591085 RepID=A0A2P8GIW7_9BACT|nr:hypothetical protein CLV60_101288 [Dyadobacter jiangsuensis]
MCVKSALRLTAYTHLYNLFYFPQIPPAIHHPLRRNQPAPPLLIGHCDGIDGAELP